MIMNNENDNNLVEINKQRIKHFFETKEIIHCTLKDGKFLNGLIFSVQDDFFEIHDRVDGVQPIFFIELKKRVMKFEEGTNARNS